MTKTLWQPIDTYESAVSSALFTAMKDLKKLSTGRDNYC